MALVFGGLAFGGPSVLLQVRFLDAISSAIDLLFPLLSYDSAVYSLRFLFSRASHAVLVSSRQTVSPVDAANCQYCLLRLTADSPVCPAHADASCTQLWFG